MHCGLQARFRARAIMDLPPPGNKAEAQRIAGVMKNEDQINVQAKSSCVRYVCMRANQKVTLGFL